MREFEDLEMTKQKCFICGCKNKVHTELFDRTNRFVGYRLKCCACGNTHDFLLNHEVNGKDDKFTPYHYGKESCVQMSYCPHKDCPLYGKRNLNPSKPSPQSKTNDMDDNISVEVYHSPNFL